MPSHRNVLYVTTRQWNPGDEFILAGVRSAVRAAGWEPKVEAIYNKSPQVVGKLTHRNPFAMKRANLSAGYLDSFVRTAHFDNSFGPGNDINFFDAVVFCGSPGWFGGRLRSLYAKLADFRGRILYLGIGSSNRRLKLANREVEVMRRAELVACRDEHLAEHLASRHEIDAQWMTCPALLAAPFEAPPPSLDTVGLVYTSSATNRGQRVAPGHEELQNRIFTDVLERHPNAEIVCNYFDEVDKAAGQFGSDRIRYAFDATDYARLMSEYSFVVSSRVHGCGLASSVGVPNVLLGHDKRAATVAGFGSMVTTDENVVLDAIARFADTAELTIESSRLLELKNALMDTYVARLKGLP